MNSPVIDKFDVRATHINSLLCIGLDSDLKHIPDQFQRETHPRFAFNRWIIDQTHPYAAAYKPNMAFYEMGGERGIHELHLTMDYLAQHHPQILTICDAKRADIANTSAAYATAIFDGLGFDVVTLHPYLGREALAPFLDRDDKGCIILCRTSNPGAGEFQDLVVDGEPLWQHVAKQVANVWNTHGNCMLVVGATYPDELRRVREIVGDMTLLIPGIGAQGGDIEASVSAGLNEQGLGMIISASRSVIFAADPAQSAKMLVNAINRHRVTTS